MNETTIVVGDAEVLTSRNPCVITAYLTVFWLNCPKAVIEETTVKVSELTPQSWGAFKTVITLRMPE